MILVISPTFTMLNQVGSLLMKKIEKRFWRLFKNNTKRFSGSLHVTSNDLFDEMYMIQSKINKLSKGKFEIYLFY